MAAMGEVPMPGGWALSAMWMPMCGQTWLGAGASFVASWILMMTPMMMPSLTPGLWVFWKEARGEQSAHAASRLTMLAGLAYVLTWAVIGALVFGSGAMLVANLMRSAALAHAAQSAPGIVIALAGAVQFTPWKARRIVCCRFEPPHRIFCPTGARAACLHGIRLARDSGYCCANLMAALLAFGMMDWRAMTAATLVMSAEALAPAPARTAKAVGVLMIATAAGCGHLT